MSENRKYYYLKLKENYFDEDVVVLLESMQDGMLYSNILLKLYLKSLKDGGRLQLDDNIPYTAQMIATITRHQIGTVERALQIEERADICPPEKELESEKKIETKKERVQERSEKADMHAYGRFGNVFLSEREREQLKADIPDKWEYYIERLSACIASSGRDYCSHIATIYKWAQEDREKNNHKKETLNYSCKEGESL